MLQLTPGVIRSTCPSIGVERADIHPASQSQTSYKQLSQLQHLLVRWLVVDHVNARLEYSSRAFCVGGR
jgi:hypothetical protein